MQLLRTQKRISFDEGAQGLLLLLLISQLFLNNGIYLFIAAICFAVIIHYLQQPLKPSVFTMIFIYHFIQIAAGIWLSNYQGVDINFKSPNTGTATIISFAGLIVLMLPIIHYQNKFPSLSLQTIREHANRLSISKTFYAYIIAFFLANLLGGIAFLFAGLTQVILIAIKVKWFLFLLFGFQVFIKNRMKKQFYLFIAIEFMLGFFSFFSDFKTVFFFLAFILITFLRRVYLRHLVLAIICLCITFFIGVLWSGVKGEYRKFLNQGQKEQVVVVSREEALEKLAELSAEQDAQTFNESVEIFLNRLQYTYHLAKAMEKVPADIPYQYGKNWRETLDFVFTPRILNPDKPRYEASVKTRKYTGLAYAGARSGTSVSLGYFADGYVDFGIIGMFVPILILGFVYGVTYFYFLRNSSSNYIFNFAVVGAIFMEFYAFEMDSTYLSGRLYVSLLVFFLLSIFFFPWLYRNLSSKAVLR